MSDSEGFQSNPFAICSATIDRKEEPEKWERCVQKVKKDMGLSEDTGLAFSDDVPGGGYLAVSDGKHWTIKDVPFFSELPANVRSNTKPIGHAWMKAVIERHKQLESDQMHLPPVHVNHHDTGRENFRIGFLKPTRVGQITIDGKDRWALFGDIVHVEEHHYRDIKDLAYPYRSAEIGRGWSPEIASLALSADESPHFKLPMLTIGDESQSFDLAFEPENRPAVAFSAVSDSSFICFSFRGVEMKTGTEIKTEKLAGHGDVEKNPDEESLHEDKVAKDIAKVIADFTASLPGIVEEILKGMVPPTVRTDEGEQPVEPAMLKELVDRQAELMAKVASLQDKAAQREEAERVEILAGKQISSLSSDGWKLSDNTEKAIREIANSSESALEKFVEEYKRNTPKEPPRTLEEISVFKEEPPELQKYRTRSPDVLSAALALSKQFDNLQEQGCAMVSSREEFIDINLEPTGERV